MKKIFTKIFMSAMILAMVLSIAACSTGTDFTPVTPANSYTVTITGGSGSGVYNEGSSVTIKADTSDDKNFDGWYEGDTLISSDAEYTFTVSKDVTYAASFSEKYSTLTITGGGYIESTGATSAQIEIGEDVTITADDNYSTKAFDYFMVGDEKVTTNPYAFTMTADDVTISTVYKETQVYIYVDGGTINGELYNVVQYFEVGESVTINYISSEYDLGYFYSWYTEVDDVQTMLSRETEYTFEVEESMFIYANLQSGYELEVTSGTITSTDSYSIENGTVSEDAVQSSAKLFEDAETTITYVEKTDETEGFRCWYRYDALGAVEILSYDSTYTFVATEDMVIFAELGDATHYDVTVIGGTFSDTEDTTAEMLNGREVTVTATAGDGYFQGWKLEGYMYSDGTDIILSYNPTYTFTVTEDVKISASYSNKIVVPSSVETDDIFYYDLNSSSGSCQYLSFFGGTAYSVCSTTNTTGVTLYFYDDCNDDRSDYILKATTTGTKVSSGTALTNVWYGSWSSSTGTVVERYDSFTTPNGNM